MRQNPAVDHQDSYTLVLPTVDGEDGSGNENQVFGTIEGTISTRIATAARLRVPSRPVV